jgi:hypothetical protein
MKVLVLLTVMLISVHLYSTDYPCASDCTEPFTTSTYTVSLGANCDFDIVYAKRDCNGVAEVVIVSITAKPTNTCTYTTVQSVYSAFVTSFIPNDIILGGHTCPTNSCIYYSISAPQCWITRYRGAIGPVDHVVDYYDACSGCCTKLFTVCRDSGNNYTVVSVTSTGDGDCIDYNTDCRSLCGQDYSYGFQTP